MFNVENLTKKYGNHTAVDNLSFTVPDGAITGFLGPNGAGKSTTMRCMLGLDRMTSGTVTVDGGPLSASVQPATTVGALLDSTWFHPGRTAHGHVRAVAAAAGLPSARADECLEMVGLSSVVNKRVGGFSLGMKQRLGLATALLGNPQNLVLDEPVNGLDPEGVHWMRDVLRQAANDGKAVLVSSHLLSEMQMIADRLVVIGRGKLIKEASLDEFINGAGQSIRIHTDNDAKLVSHLQNLNVPVISSELGLKVQLDGPIKNTKTIAVIARELDLLVTHLSEDRTSLEDAYLAATDKETVYHTV
ncbi:ABC transporter ATP-binding protein [Corynebacterium ulceribovis]|uniref:ABC transporter ATP-binding protein n=1 Tax=Corynebacterium ulceribovis TaxID=487732 RepID=UPI000374E324|nr:ABC transporter ATP-binding protein [Corynebacterium ulceribovis]